MAVRCSKCHPVPNKKSNQEIGLKLIKPEFATDQRTLERVKYEWEHFEE